MTFRKTPTSVDQEDLFSTLGKKNKNRLTTKKQSVFRHTVVKKHEIIINANTGERDVTPMCNICE